MNSKSQESRAKGQEPDSATETRSLSDSRISTLDSRLDDPQAFARAWRTEVLPKAAGVARFPAGMCLWSMFDADSANSIAPLAHQVFSQSGRGAKSVGRSTIKARRAPDVPLDQLIAQLVQQPDPWSDIEVLATADVLLSFGRTLDASSVCSLWKRLAAERSAAPSSSTDDHPDRVLMREGETPLVAGLLLSPLREAKKLRDFGRRRLVRELFRRTDRDGAPHAELLPRLALWLAPLIRATWWAEQFGFPLWTDEERQRLSLLLERAVPLCRPDGRLALSNGLAVPALPLFDAAAKSFPLTGPAEKLLKTLRQPSRSAKLKKRSSTGVESMPSAQSDWARFAILRSDWGPLADSLAISHHQPIPQLEVTALGRPILHGGWGLELQIGDAEIEPAPEWSCACWMSDPDADYLELQMSGPGGLRVERQVLLSRKEHFLLLADCLRGCRSIAKPDAASPEEPRIHLRSRLPLADGVTAEADRATREIRLQLGKQTVRVFPLALADDRIQSTPHRFAVENGELTLHQIGVGNGLYAPLIFDWHPAHGKKPALWRTLTVTEAGKVVGRDVAAGHRLQIGKLQLLLYRSLSAPKTPRAVLGHHTYFESVIAKFDADGDVDAIMNVER